MTKLIGINAEKMKMLHFAFSLLIFLYEIYNFGYRLIQGYSSIDIGDCIIFAIVICLFFLSRIWLTRVTVWGLVLAACLLPCGIFPPFGDEKGSFFDGMSLNQRIVLFFVIEIVLVSVAGLLLKLTRMVVSINQSSSRQK